ncbi:MAG: 16S rRNA (uracil(1498)-N(3))-methyltransferase [Selenomonadaceae bacterium]|nr:16S rRNA (uracil(1498)-N(3))-methyltransferase [Selenomonadaceae bacterium]
MRRLFYGGLLADTVAITGEDAHHLMHSCRARLGDRLTVVDDRGQVALMEMIGFSNEQVTLKLIEPLPGDTESPMEIILAPCLLKGDKLDLVVQKAVELGAVGVMPLVSQNSVPILNEKKRQGRQERWQKIADEAAKQCGRQKRLVVSAVTSLTDFLRRRQETSDSTLLFCYENETAHALKERLGELTSSRIFLLVGPEGGFTLPEAAAIEEGGGQSVTLGKRILRAETAALAIMSIVQYELGDLG